MLLIKQTASDLSDRLVELDADHKPAAAHLLDPRRSRNRSLEVLADLVGVLHKVLFLEYVRDRVGGGHSEIVAAECGAEHSLGGLELRRDQHSADRKSVGHSLGHRDDVRHDSGPLVGEEPAAAAVTALDLVEDKHHAGLFGHLAQVAKEPVVRDHDAADSLDALDDHRGHISFGDFRLHGLYVIERQKDDIVVRVERRGVFRVVGDGHGSRGPSVEGSLERDHLVLAGVEGSEFESVLVGLRSRIDQEQGIVLQTGEFSDFLRQFHLERILHAVGVESDLAELVGDGGDILRMAVAYRNHRMASVEVKILLSFVVPDTGTLRFDRSHVKEGIYVE